MGLIYRRRIQVGHETVNLSRSGASITRRFGPITLNSRGHITVHLARGLSFRIR